MITNDMQDQFPFDPPPPPGEPAGAAYGHWSSNPADAPPPWPPTTPGRGRSSTVRRMLIAGLAVVCLAAGGGTAWAVTSSALTHNSTGLVPNDGSNGGGFPNSSPAPLTGGSSASAAAIAKVEAATVDITASTANGNGQVAATGMIITSSGQVLTNNHVIDHVVNITAQIDGAGTSYKATVIGYDAQDDVALLQLQGASNLPTVPIGDSSQVAMSDQVTVIGNALGRGGPPAVVSGIVTLLDQAITASDESGGTEQLTGMLQVQANIQPGDSGGPEINSAGQVIGMTTAGSQSSTPTGPQAAATTGFAIPINKAMQIVSEIRSGSGPNIHIGLAALLGVSVAPGGTTGAVVAGVRPNTPAVGAGIVAGDVITKINGQTIASANDLNKAMETFSSGQSPTFVWIDATGTSHSASITLGLAGWAD
jgi:S1-C subfamily serine protease